MSGSAAVRQLLAAAEPEDVVAGHALLRPSTVARRLSVNVSTVRRWVIAEKIAAITLPGGYYRIPASEVERIRATLTSAK